MVLIILITLSTYKALCASKAPHTWKLIGLFNTQRMEASRSYKLDFADGDADTPRGSLLCPGRHKGLVVQLGSEISGS